jgi:endo-1,3-1,4-beta-glycanase ExoK
MKTRPLAACVALVIGISLVILLSGTESIVARSPSQTVEPFGVNLPIQGRPDRGPVQPADSASFFDDMNDYDQDRWNKADGWTNGGIFNVGWRADHIIHTGIMTIILDDQPCPDGCSGKPYASGEYRTAGSDGAAYYGYGCFEARLKAAAGSGLVTSFFTYNGGTWDTPPGGNGLHNEIDIEFLGKDLGKDTTQMQTNFFANGEIEHTYTVTLTFDAAEDFHVYGFKWTESGIEWYVDGSSVHSVTNTVDDPTPDATPENGGPQKIMMNFWACTGADAWCGPFTYTSPLYAEYDWVKYDAGSDCTLVWERIYIPLVLNNY